MKIAVDTGRAIRILRKRASKTQKEVAEAAGISKNLLSNWETGTTAPSMESLEKVLTVLGADLLDLHNSIALLQGRPTDHPPSIAVDLTRLSLDGQGRQAQLLARAPEVLLWVLQLLDTLQDSKGKKP